MPGPYPAITVYGAAWCPDCKNAKRFLGEHLVPYTWVDLGEHPDAQAIVERYNGGKQIIPTIVFADGSVLVEPSNADLAAKLGLHTAAKSDTYDLIVIGAGPAGLTAAIYAAREGIDVLVIDRAGTGGQAAITERLDNYPAFPDGITGADFADRIARQAQRFGVEIVSAQEVTALGRDRDHLHITTADQHTYCAEAALIASGSTYRRLEVPGEDDYIGAGVHFCATCDGPFYKGRPVVVIGGGNSAAEESAFLTGMAEHVTLLVRGAQLNASKVAQDKLPTYANLTARYNSEVTGFEGAKGHLTAVRLRDTAKGTEETLPTAAAFIFIGLTPNTAFVRDAIDLDVHGFVRTNEQLETSVPGIFAAGDCRHGSTKQIASAVGEGATAALMIRHYLQQGEQMRGAAEET
ncbi:MAG TPA: FAD-dependent oxidoreductase [Chloroflexota bacterium]|nr:FAD-dependent oxidoreductase [Chloroflexota bacterium]